jgi:hypothetical protein
VANSVESVGFPGQFRPHKIGDKMATKKTAGGFDGCTREQQKQLLEFFMYRLGGQKCDLREELAANLPTAYNAWCGRDIVSVVSTSDPQRKWSTTPVLTVKLGKPRPAFGVAKQA